MAKLQRIIVRLLVLGLSSGTGSEVPNNSWKINHKSWDTRPLCRDIFDGDIDHWRVGRFLSTAAEISVIPYNHNSQQYSNIRLTAANGARIKRYGPKPLGLDFGSSRSLTWTFEISDDTRIMIGADFLHYFNRLVDIRFNRLIDLTNKRVVITIFAMDYPVLRGRLLLRLDRCPLEFFERNTRVTIFKNVFA